jgi:hypothetical protein
MGTAGLALLLLGVPCLGAALLRLAGCRPAPLARLGFAIALGFVATALWLELDLLVTGSVHFLPATLLLAAGTLFELGATVRTWRRPALDRRDVFLVPLGLLVLLVAATGRSAPFSGYDAKAIYGLKAKALLYERDLAGPIFQDPDVIHYHADYPNGLPLLMALAGWVTEGDPEDAAGERSARSARLWVERHDAVDAYMPLAALWTLGLIALVAARIRAHTRGPVTALACSVLALPVVVVYPWVGGGSWSLAGADVPLALSLGAAALAALEAVRSGRRGWHLVAALLAAGAITLKWDALVAVLLLPVVLALVLRPRRRALRTAGALLAGSLAAFVVAWLLARRTAGSAYDEDYLGALAAVDPAALLGRVPLLLHSIWDVLRMRFMGVFWLFVNVVALPVGWWRGGETRALALWVALSLLAFTGVFLVTPNHVTWHVETALPRIWCQLALPAGLLVVEAALWLFRAPGARENEPDYSTSM